MKKLILFCSFLLVSFVGFGQCPGSLYLTSQGQVDQFPINYPNCTDILGDVVINSQGITDLNALSQLSSIGGDLLITADVQNFNGLHNVVSIGGNFDLFNLSSVNDLSGFTNLQSIGKGFRVYKVWYLENFNGLQSLNSIGVDSSTGISIHIEDNQNLLNFIGFEGIIEVPGNFVIGNNPSLSNFEGFNNLQQVQGFTYISLNSITSFEGLDDLYSTEYFSIYGNDSLTNLTGLENLSIVNGHFEISNNDNLINVNGISGLTQVLETVAIHQNLNLQNLNGLSNLISTPKLLITENMSLTSIMGLSNLDPLIIEEIIITYNNILPKCDINAVCENLNNASVYIAIYDNAENCQNETQVELDCESVDIPDANFLSTLLNHSPIIDLNGDGNIQFYEAESFNGIIQAGNKNISDFTGLEAFVNISGFEGTGNNITFLDISYNVLLNSVDFHNNGQLENVNMKNGNNTAIIDFNGVNCVNLEAICVDNVSYAVQNFTNIDPHVEFVEDCSILGFSSFNLGSAVTIFPNPTSSILNIDISENIEHTNTTIYSIRGEAILTTSDKQFDISTLSEGIYIVQINTDKGSITKKIVKE